MHKWSNRIDQGQLGEDAIDIQLPREIERVLSLKTSQHDARLRNRDVSHLVDDVISGRANPASKGDRVWEVGDQDVIGSESEDEWDTPGMEWAAGEL